MICCNIDASVYRSRVLIYFLALWIIQMKFAVFCLYSTWNVNLVVSLDLKVYSFHKNKRQNVLSLCTEMPPDVVRWYPSLVLYPCSLSLYINQCETVTTFSRFHLLLWSTMELSFTHCPRIEEIGGQDTTPTIYRSSRQTKPERIPPSGRQAPPTLQWYSSKWCSG